MNSLIRIMSYDKIKLNQENCNCEDCTNAEIENRFTEYTKLSEEEIEQIINERYSNKDEKTKIFIRKALHVHNTEYNYSKVIYKNNKTKVEIICKINNHLSFFSNTK